MHLLFGGTHFVSIFLLKMIFIIVSSFNLSFTYVYQIARKFSFFVKQKCFQIV